MNTYTVVQRTVKGSTRRGVKDCVKGQKELRLGSKVN